MKKIILPAIAFACLSLFACNKITYDDMTVVRDCTGTYLHLAGKDYHVCNIEKTASIATGTIIKARFIRLGSCTGPAVDEIICKMYHLNEGWIEVQSIK